MLTIGSLFSGIGGLELGLERAGLGPVLWQCEIDPFCRRVLAKHWPNVTRYEDVTRPRDYAHVDLICGGFPCQDVSAAGKLRGIGGERSSLWWHFARIIEQISPQFVVVENVTSGKVRWLPYVRHQLHLLGYDTEALGIAARDVGAPHRRERVFVVAHARGVLVRKQSRRLRGKNRTGPAIAGGNGLDGSVADAGREGSQGVLAAEPFPAECSGRVPRGNHWETEPNVGRVAHGVPARVDRLRALGNAVVPQCAEIVGRVIRTRLNFGSIADQSKQKT